MKYIILLVATIILSAGCTRDLEDCNTAYLLMFPDKEEGNYNVWTVPRRVIFLDKSTGNMHYCSMDQGVDMSITDIYPARRER